MKLTLIFTLIMAYCYVLHGFNFTQSREPEGIFVIKTHDVFTTHSDWKLYYYLELDEFYNDNEQLKTCIKKIEKICSEIPSNEHCTYLVTRFHRHLEFIKSEMNFIDSFHLNTRNKRAPLGIFGDYYFKPLFGLMTRDEADQITEKINEIIDHQEQHKISLIDEFSLIKQTIKFTNESLSSLRENLHVFDERLNDLIKEQNKEITQHMITQYLSSIAILIIVEHESTLKTLKEVTRKTFNGDFTDLVTIKQFRNDLIRITEELDSETTILTENGDDILSINAIKHHFTNNRIIIEISLPIINRSSYKLAKVATVPLTLNNRTILINTDDKEYLVNDEKSEYISISEFEIKQCKLISDHRFICPTSREIYLKNEDICESGILFGADINNILQKCTYKYAKANDYIKQLHMNTYFIFTRNEINITEKCRNKAPEKYSIKTPGKLYVNPECELKWRSMRISASNSKLSKITPVIESPYKSMKLSPKNLNDLELRIRHVRTPKISFVNYDKNFLELTKTADKQIKNLEEINPIQKVLSEFPKLESWHIMAICILILLSVVIRKCC